MARLVAALAVVLLHAAGALAAQQPMQPMTTAQIARERRLRPFLTPVSVAGLRSPHAPQHETHNSLELIRVGDTHVWPDASIKITVDKTNLAAGEWVEVSWSGVSLPDYSDWVAVWPAGANVTTTSPLKYRAAAESPGHLTTGAGHLSFRLINYRVPVAFAIVRNGFMSPTVAAFSDPIAPINRNEPTQVHLALTGRAGEMRVSWVSADAQAPAVRWGTAPGKYPHRSAASSGTYTQDDMCGEPAKSVGWLAPGTLHSAVMTGLQPNSRYYYKVGDDGAGLSAEMSFVAAPLPGAQQTVRLLAVADMGQGEADGSMEFSEMQVSRNTTRLMAEDVARDGYGLLLHLGDISYARGYAAQWDNYFDQLQLLASRLPYMVAIGNHERDFPGSGDLFGGMDSGGECGVPYERRLPMPTPGPDQPWYAFDWGPVHFLQYSTEHPFAVGTPQHDFILRDLKGVDRRRTPWVIVGGHRPLYISSNYDAGPASDLVVARALRAAYEQAFAQYKVDMTWHGHHHSYQRSCPVYNETCVGYDEQGVARGTVHLVIGNAGAGLTTNLADPPPAWLEASHMWWGYLRVTANGTALTCESVSDADGAVVDSVVLRKPANWGHRFMAAQKPAVA